MIIRDPQVARNFLFAGHATFTLRSVRTGTRFTYRLDKKKDGDTLYLKVLCAPDVWKFSGALYMQADTHKYAYHNSKSSQLHALAPSIKAFDWFIRHLQEADGHFHPQLELWHEGKCGKCGRALTVPESIATGLGPDCAASMGIQMAKLMEAV